MIEFILPRKLEILTTNYGKVTKQSLKYHKQTPPQDLFGLFFKN